MGFSLGNLFGGGGSSMMSSDNWTGSELLGQGGTYLGAMGVGSSIWGQQETNAANATQANNMMDFQRNMSNTAYRRAMADMKAAGLNPMLAANNGGASTPGGAQATMQNPFEGVNASAMSAIQTAANLKQIDATVDKTKADTLSSVAQASLIKAQEAATGQSAKESLARTNQLKGEQPMITAGGKFGDAVNSIIDAVMPNKNAAKPITNPGHNFYQSGQTVRNPNRP